MKAIINPKIGATTIKPIILSITGELITAKLPAAATAAPVKPPISVCDELEGIPYHHVIKFQIIAAINPDMITSKLMAPLTVLAMVSPTP